MGQQPNIAHGVEDLPRPTPKPGPARRWSPRRPAEIMGPEDERWGASFGTPGPNTGFAIKIVRGRELPGRDSLRPDVEAAVVAVMAARASAIGRAPTAPDADVALTLLAIDEESAQGLAGVAGEHRRLAALVAAIPEDELIA